MPTPYLIQRLIRAQVDDSLKSHRFGEVWRLDYMGSAEFEFGAFAEFIRHMDSSDLQAFTATIGGKKVFGVCIAGIFKSDDELHQYLNSIAKGTVRLKESAQFPPSKEWHAATAWADIENGVFWSFENMNLSIVNMFANSVAYMDSQK